jgi:hypothetical protein
VSERQRLSHTEELRLGIAIARDDFDLTEKIDEATLADALRHDARALDYPHLLRAVADALDSPDAEYRLRLVRTRRGRPVSRNGEADLRRAYFVEWRMRQARIPLKAAVMDAMDQFSCSRATVFRSLKRHRELAAMAAELNGYFTPDKLRR